MTLIFSGNNYKYELEGVMKLFIPATLFTHVFSDSIDTEDDYVFAQKKDNADNVCLSVKVRYDGKTCEKEEFVHFESDMELSLSRLLFKAMSEITGIVPKWGVITGIRPVKRVNDMLSEGMNKAEIFKAMESRYLCSEEKCDIAYKTAITQKPVLDELEKDSFSLYVSVPFCPTRCSYCSFVSQSIEGCMKLIPEYVNKLCEEIVYTAKITEKLGLKLDTVYFGGGTPSLLSPADAARLIAAAAPAPGAEITLEANPETVTEQTLCGFREAGVNRISFGVQSARDSQLKTLGRPHTAKQARAAFAAARRAGFENISGDIMLALPHYTQAEFDETLELIEEGGATHISAYLLKIEPDSAFGRTPPEGLPTSDEAADFYLYAVEQLEHHGYLQYEISNFARPGYEGKHNLIYWDCGDYLGIGPAAHSCMGGKRFYYPADTEAFLRDEAAPVMVGGCGAEDYLFLQLRLRKGLNLD